MEVEVVVTSILDTSLLGASLLASVELQSSVSDVGAAQPPQPRYGDRQGHGEETD